jgi:hypothetical protein
MAADLCIYRQSEYSLDLHRYSNRMYQIRDLTVQFDCPISDPAVVTLINLSFDSSGTVARLSYRHSPTVLFVASIESD